MVHVSTLLPEELLRRLDQATVALAARLPGFRRSDAYRAALERGLAVLERELEGKAGENAR